MARTLKFTLPYPPSLNNLYPTSRSGRRYLSAEGKSYKQLAAAMALQAGVRVMDGELIVTMDFYRPRKSGDLSNRVKAAEDALTGIAYHDDSQIVDIHARRFEDKANPRVEVTIEPTEG